MDGKVNEPVIVLGDTPGPKPASVVNGEPAIVIDDSESIRRIVRAMLMGMGFTQIKDFASVEELMRDRVHGARLIISDIELKSISGLDLLAALRRDDQLKSVKILLMTGSRRADHARTAKRLGANGLLLKPFTQPVLQRSIELASSLSRRRNAG